MFTNLSKIPIKLGILLVGVGLLVAGCDSAGTNNQKDKTENEVEEKIAFEGVDGNVGDRITYFDGSSSNSVTTAAQKSVPGFKIEAHFGIYGGSGSAADKSASHLALSSKKPNSAPRNLYVGYKTPDPDQSGATDDDFGGGIDILDAPPGGTISQATETGSVGDVDALRSGAVDVQELAVANDGSDPDVLYAATAINPDVTLPRAPQLHSIELGNDDGLPDSDIDYDLVELLNSQNTGNSGDDPTKVAKSVVVDKAGSSWGNAFAVSDENTAHAISVASPQHEIAEPIETLEQTTATPQREYRSVTQTSTGGIYALSYSGNVHELDLSTSPQEVTSWDVGSFASGSNGSGAGPADASIARISSHDFDGGTVGEELLLVALNDNGIRVVDLNGNVVFKDTDDYATSVTATDEYVYVASGNGIAVYEVRSGLSNNTVTEGLEYLGTQPLTDLDGGSGNANESVQINDIIVDSDPTNNILYVAKGTDGVFQIEQNVDSAWDQ